MTCDECFDDDAGEELKYILNRNSKICVKSQIKTGFEENPHLYFCEEIGTDGQNCEKCLNNSYPLVRDSTSELHGCVDIDDVGE